MTGKTIESLALEPNQSDNASSVEVQLKNQGLFTHFPDERTQVAQFDSVSSLGQAVALRFIEWTQQNPQGVCSLPTGKTPEHFIRWMNHFLDHWGETDIDAILDQFGLSHQRPVFSGLRFVQIDEFIPMPEDHPNRFLTYIHQHYFESWGFDIKRSLVMDFSTLDWPQGLSVDDIFPDQSIDLTLRTRAAQTDLERLQQSAIMVLDNFAQSYEQQIREMGGLGFFLGGIGPDGHIAFNIRGSNFYSTTRLLHTNFETQAAAANDLGGIEIAARKAVMTIGLETISFNPEVIAIIMAAGEAKAGVISRAIMDEASIENPASILQDLVNSRFYLTTGATINLADRHFSDVESGESIDDDGAVRALVDLSIEHQATILDLSSDQLNADRYGALILQQRGWSPEKLTQFVYGELVARLENGLKMEEETNFLHTGPHPDDIMLGLLPHIIHQVRPPTNVHDFAVMTSGFTSIPNSFMSKSASSALSYMEQWDFKKRWKDGFFNLSADEVRDRSVKEYHEALIIENAEERSRAVSRQLIRTIMDLYGANDVIAVQNATREVLDQSLSQLPGAKDPQKIQTLKGTIREFEENLVWAHYGFGSRSVHHLRLAFYRGDYFTANPTRHEDIPPIKELFDRTKPDIVSLAFDPEGTGPDTHFKVMQAISTYLADNRGSYSDDLAVWGYRNVWHRFHPGEANMYVPVSANSMATLDHTFKSCYITQKDASFPSYMHDGAFSELVQKIFVDQYSMLRTALGEAFWREHSNPRLRSTYGMLLIRKMSAEQFITAAESLMGLVGRT